MENFKNKIKNLTEKINRYNYEYYSENISSVTDYEYDALIQQLMDLEKKYPQWKSESSPSNRVGDKVSKIFNKITHREKMLSLDNCFTEKGISVFIERAKKILQTSDELIFYCEPKIDGLSISLLYENGILIQAVTRGDGSAGEDVLENVKTIHSVPLEIPYMETIEVRGEIYFPISQFNKVNLIRQKKGQVAFANPRNAAAGTIRQLDSKIVAERKLQVFVYQIVNPEIHEIYNQADVFTFLIENQFNVVKESMLAANFEEITQYIWKMGQMKTKLNYEMDGIVIKINNLIFAKKLGNTDKFVRSAIAYKFPAERVETTLLKIFSAVGRTGKITYNAILSPVKIAGTTVQAATLHNENYIKELNLYEGARVIIYKAGEIIPKIESLANSSESLLKTKWKPDKTCPSCKQKLIRYNDKVDKYCVNKQCKGILLEKLIHFCSKDALDISGMGYKIVTKLFKMEFLSDFVDVYRLRTHKNELCHVDGFNIKMLENLFSSIENSKTAPVEKFLFAIGIRYVGKRTAKIITKHFKDFNRIINVTVDELSELKEIGNKISNELIQYWQKTENKEMFKQLLNMGIKPSFTENFLSQKLKGKSFVITGTLSKPRSYFENLIERNSGIIKKTISNNLNYLVAGKETGKKIIKSKELKIKIITESDLDKLIYEK